jgi:hypothetical protein
MEMASLVAASAAHSGRCTVLPTNPGGADEASALPPGSSIPESDESQPRVSGGRYVDPRHQSNASGGEANA